MKNTSIITLLFILGFSLFAQGQNRTYYYEKVAQVKNGNRTSASGDGHYLTMNNKILYESNPNGTSLNYGMMQYEGDNNGVHTYGGNAYLGRGLTYYFASDYSRLNVELYDGTILVYERKNQANSSRMRGYQNKQSSTASTSIPNTTIPTTTTTTTTTTSKYDNTYEYKCVYCNGTGRETINTPINVVSFCVQEPEKVTCSECGYSYDKHSTAHRHQICTHCRGKGVIKGKVHY